MVNLRLKGLIARARKNLEFGLCFTCGKYKRPSKTIKKYSEKCNNSDHQYYYYDFEWTQYKKNNQIKD